MKYDLLVLALGAGVQSSALALMADEGRFGERPDCAIFADTQWEPEEVYEQLEWIEERVSFPIHRVSFGNIRKDVLNAFGGVPVGQYGQPPFYVRESDEAAALKGRSPDVGGALWRRCTTEYKIQPIQKKIRELLGYKKRQRIKKQAQQWFGISTDEAHRMRDSRVSWIHNYYPLCESGISRGDCEKFLVQRGMEKPRKSACIGCPYHTNGAWVNMKKHHPKDWRDAVDFDAKLRMGKLPGVTGDAYLHRRMVPLELAVLKDYNEDQIELFGDFAGECEGMCGV